MYRVTLEVDGEEYTFLDEWDGCAFNWEEGNYSCDCNRSIALNKYFDLDLDEMTCGESIKLVRLEYV